MSFSIRFTFRLNMYPSYHAQPYINSSWDFPTQNKSMEKIMYPAHTETLISSVEIGWGQHSSYNTKIHIPYERKWEFYKCG